MQNDPKQHMQDCGAGLNTNTFVITDLPACHKHGDNDTMVVTHHAGKSMMTKVLVSKTLHHSPACAALGHSA